MCTKKELVEFLNKNYSDNEEIFIHYSDVDNINSCYEFSCNIISEDEIIIEAQEEISSDITDIDSALEELADYDNTNHIMEINL